VSAAVQAAVVAVIVLAAGAYVARRVWLTLRPRRGAGCAHDCGCGDGTRGGSDWAGSA
jgi:hypothetical protein